MLKTISDLNGLTIAATDGEIGSIQDIYFDDVSWTVRYLVVDTGTWLPGRQVLISPMAVGGPSWGVDRVPVKLTKRQVEQSPSVEAEKPVNRQYELQYSRYYGYPYYWAGPYRWGGAPYPREAVVPPPEAPAPPTPPEGGGDPHLRSARDVMQYYIEATDGDIGHVEDFLVDDRDWAIRYMIVDTRNWWPGRKVLVSPEWIQQVRWEDNRVHVDLSREGIKAAPEFDPGQPVERAYESRLFGHHRRPSYWE